MCLKKSKTDTHYVKVNLNRFRLWDDNLFAICADGKRSIPLELWNYSNSHSRMPSRSFALEHIQHTLGAKEIFLSRGFLYFFLT